MKSIVALLVVGASVDGLIAPNVTEDGPPNGKMNVWTTKWEDGPPNGGYARHSFPEQLIQISVQCTKANCDSPKFYVVTDGNWKMNVWTTNDQNEAYSSTGGYDWWGEHCAREIYDAGMNKVLHTSREKHSVTDEVLGGWLSRAKEVRSCKYPSGDWEHVFGVDNPKASHTHSVTSSNGYTRNQENSFTKGVSITAGVSIASFSASTTLSYSATVTNSQTWLASKDVTNSITVSPGNSVHTWQWKLTCMGFTDYGLFTEKVTYATNIFKDTSQFKQPTCLPQNCNGKSIIDNPPTLV